MGAQFMGLAPQGRMVVPIRRALSQTDVSGKITQVIVDPLLEDLILVNNPLWANLPRRPGQGPQAQISQRTVRGVAAFVDDTDTPTAVKSTFGTPPTFPFKTLLYNGQVTRRAQAITRNYIALLAEEIESGVQEVRDIWENEVINGDVGVNAKGFNGFKKFIADNSAQQVLMATNGAPLTLAKMDESLDLVYASPSFGVYTKRTKRQLNGLLQIQQRFQDRTTVDGGFSVPTYNNIPLFWSQWLSDAQTCGTGTTCSSIEWINTSKIYAEDLTPLFRIPLAQISSQFDAFDLGIDTVLVNRNPKYLSELAGILP